MLKNLSGLRHGKKPGLYWAFAIVSVITFFALSLHSVLNSNYVKVPIYNAISTWADSAGLEINIGSINVNFTHISFREVTINLPIEYGGSFYADIVHMSFNPFNLLFGNFRDSIEMSGEAFSTAGQEDGESTQVILPPIQVSVTEGKIKLNESKCFLLSFHAHLKGNKVYLTGLNVDFVDHSYRGRFMGEGEIRQGSEGVIVQGKVGGKDLRLTIAEDIYNIDEVEISYLMQNNHLRIVDSKARSGEGDLTFWGDVSPNLGLDLQIAYRGKEISEEIPVLAGLGFAGTGELNGKVSGTLFDPILEGEAAVGPESTVWGRANVQGTGFISLNKERITFKQVDLDQYQGHYQLEGMYQFARGVNPGYLDLDIYGEMGNVEEAFSLMGIEYPLHGTWTGALFLVGPIDDLQVSGEIEARELTVYDQSLEEVDTTFHWQDGIISIDSASWQEGPGKISVTGQIKVNRPELALSFAASNWPLDSIPGVIGHQEYIGGSIDIKKGLIKGAPTDLRISGEVSSEVLRVGKMSFTSLRGELRYEKGQLNILELNAQREGEAFYQLSGVIGPIGSRAIPLGLVMKVSDESLSNLLWLMGQRVPAMLFDSNISGQVNLSGTTQAPEARADISWADHPFDLPDMKGTLILKDGRVEVQDWELMPNQSLQIGANRK